MLIYVCVPGIFIGVNVNGYVLPPERGQYDTCRNGMLMLPWSVASFLAIATGRYFNRIGPRPRGSSVACCRRWAFPALVNVDSAMLLPAAALR